MLWQEGMLPCRHALDFAGPLLQPSMKKLTMFREGWTFLLHSMYTLTSCKLHSEALMSHRVSLVEIGQLMVSFRKYIVSKHGFLD